MGTTEIELTFLAKMFPPNLAQMPHKDMLDIYIPSTIDHPQLRIRRNGDGKTITKKSPLNIKDKSIQIEQTISLSDHEFEALSQINGKRVHKTRYSYTYKNTIIEVDIFLEDLAGLVLIDFEFMNEEDKNNFQAPNFCLAEVTQEKFLAGGMLAGKSYEDIEKDLRTFNYTKLV